MNCENLVQNNVDQTSEKVGPNKLVLKINYQKPTTESIIKQTTDIVFNNQTSKLLKKQSTNEQCKSSSTPVMGKYNLRKKSVQIKSDSIKKANQPNDRHLRGLKDKDSKPKKRNSQLSRYKRKNANARERNRVQEINAAFETLKRILPKGILEPKMDEKRTKIATLRDAADYIACLSELINKPNPMNPSIGDKIVNCESDKHLNISMKEVEKIDQSKMDTLPDISFISPDELSILTCISDEETPISEQCTHSNINGLLNDMTSVNKITISTNFTENNHYKDSVLQSIEHLNSNSNLLNSSQLFQSPDHAGNSNDNCDLNNNQEFCVNSPVPVNHQNFISHNQQISSQAIRIVQSNHVNNRFYTSHHTPSNFKIANEIVLQDSNSQCVRSKYATSPPLFDKYEHNTPIGGHFHLSQYSSDNLASNTTIKNVPYTSSDDLFSALGEDIENDNLYSSWSSTSDYFV